MYNSDDFLQRYREFETWAKKTYGEEGVYRLEKYHYDNKIRHSVSFFRNIRNVLSHNTNDKNEPFVILTDAFKERFESFCHNLMDNISQIYIPKEEIYTREMHHKILPTVNYMKKKSFSYVPIMDGNKVCGVFSEATLFDYIGDGNASDIDDNMLLSNMRSYLTDYSTNGSYDFASETATIEEVREIFSDAISNGRRLDVLYITTTGDQNGDLVGLVSVWDISKLK